MSFTPYQVDHSVQNTAKTMGFSKKKVIFKFGFANEAALRDKRTGADCRGSEHEIIFVWSLKTGKRELSVDGKRIHFSESGQNGWTVDRSWSFKFTLTDKNTHHRYKIQFVSQPTNNRDPSTTPQLLLKPFDLIISGLSYFQFNPIYELGAPNMIIMPLEDSMTRHLNRNNDDAMMDPEERRQLAAAKLASLRDLQASNNNPNNDAPRMQHAEQPLISFDDEISPQDPTQRASSITLDPAIDDKLPAPYPAGAPPPPPPPNTSTIYGGAPNPYAPQSYTATTSQNNNPFAMVPVGNSGQSVSYGVDASGRLAVQQPPPNHNNNPFANPYSAASAPSYGSQATQFGQTSPSLAYGQAPAPMGSPYGQAPAPFYGQAPAASTNSSYGQAQTYGQYGAMPYGQQQPAANPFTNPQSAPPAFAQPPAAFAQQPPPTYY